MDVHHMPLFRFLEGSGKSFVIPVYQRDYAWTRVNCQKLWDDMCSLVTSDRKDHFLGAIVAISSGYDEYSIIDGQQRLTTATLLLIALHNYLKKQENKSELESTLENQILDFLINKYSRDTSSDKRIRLKPNKQDKVQFERLFGNFDNLDNTSNIISNYNFFVDRVSEKKLTPQQLFDAFKDLKIVLISLERNQDDPQLIFESLNSTGVDLTAGDLIRNYILMDLEPAQQEKMYLTYWTDIELLSGDLAEFVRYYLIYKTKTSVKKEEVYAVFKKVADEEFHNDKEKILQELIGFAKIFSWFVQTRSHDNAEINTRLARIKKLEFTVCYPYLLDVFYDVKNGNLGEEIVPQILQVLESYAFRKILVDNSTQGLNKMFISLARDIKKEETWKSHYLDILNFILLEKGASQKFPSDEDFESALINKEIYRFQSKNKNFLLESLENYKSAIQIDLDNSDLLTIEHIMPQTPTPDWKNKLGENWQEIHTKYLHTLGNLTLTANNSLLSNHSIEDKQKIDFQTSKLKLNFKIEGVEKWSEAEIVERAKSLIRDAVQIWPYPTTSYVKTVPDEQLFDLTSEDNFSNFKPNRLYIGEGGTSYELKSWRELLLRVCRYLYEFSPTQFAEIQQGDLKFYFDMSRPLKHPLAFAPDRYIEGYISANGVVRLLNKICERMNYSPEQVQFSLKN